MPVAASGAFFSHGEGISDSVVSGRAKMGVCVGPAMIDCVQGDQLARVLDYPQV